MYGTKYIVWGAVAAAGRAPTRPQLSPKPRQGAWRQHGQRQGGESLLMPAWWGGRRGKGGPGHFMGLG